MNLDPKPAAYFLFTDGLSTFGTEEPAAADKALSRMIQEFPDHELIPQSRFARAMARHQLQDHAKAVEDLEAVLAVEPPVADQLDLATDVAHNACFPTPGPVATIRTKDMYPETSKDT